MTDSLTIVRAVYSGLSQRQATATYHVSRNTVSLLLRHAKAQGWLTLEVLSHLDNATFSKALETACITKLTDHISCTFFILDV
jgi:transposase